MSNKEPMGTSASTVEDPILPGTFDVDGTAGLLDDPYGHLERIQRAWRAKNHEKPWSNDALSEVELGDVDWRLYNAPAGLLDAGVVGSDIIQDIIATSLQNISARNEQELQREREEAATRKEAEEEAAREAEKNKEPYLPIKIAETPIVPDVQPESAVPGKAKDSNEPKPDDGINSIRGNISIMQARVEKRSKFAIKGLFQRGSERGESSSAGAAREAMRRQLEKRLSKVNIETTAPEAQHTIAALRRHTSVRVPEKQELVECVSCLDDFSTEEVIKVPCHSYCKDCFIRLIQAACKNEQQWPPKCCLNEIPFRTITKYIPEDLKKTFRSCQQEWDIPISERLYCYEPECSALLQPADINHAKKIGRCRQAHHTCTMCRGQAHGNKDCPQDHNMMLTNTLAEQEGWKRCSQCNALVEHKEACQHMTCRCGHQFCYVCSRRWRTCHCTMQNLNELKAAIEVRREQREIQEQAEASELMEILREIEQFELEEARRAEEERQEQLRLAEERWQKIIKERLMKETLRRRSVENKFQQLRTVLDSVHEGQRATIASQHDDATCDLATESKTKEETLKKSQAVELSSIKEKISKRVSDREAEFDRDYALRAAKEQTIEQDYEEQLRQYWTEDKESAKESIESAMLLLRQRMDKAYHAWLKWKDAELATYRGKLEEERSIREELMYSAKHRLIARNGDAEDELAKRIVAERKWVHEAILERERLLGAAETAEMEGDADSLFAADELQADGAQGDTQADIYDAN